MKQLKFCRLCTKQLKDASLRKLFEKRQRNWLKIIKQITGILLKKSKSLPQYICKECQKDLEKVYEFRERCIYAQEYFNTEDYAQFKVAINTNTIKNTASAEGHNVEINEMAPSADIQPEICFVKEESRELFQIEESPRASDSCEDFVAIEKEEIVIDGNKLSLMVEIQTEKEFDECNPEPTKCKEIQKNTVRKKNAVGEKNQTFICDKCGNNFTCKQHFLTHLRRHTGDKKFQCEICPNKFFTHSELNRHMRRHTGERPFPCKHCGRRFSHVTTRIKHERTHTNERPFTCTQCCKGFTTSNNLRNHMLVHTGERSFRCELCNKAFQRQTHLVVHYKSIIHKKNVDKQEQCTSSLSAGQISVGNISKIEI